jgi:hypothetical protein
VNQNPCPKCGISPNIEDVESIFGMRQNGGRSIRQSYCRKCRSSSLTVTPKKLAKPAKAEKPVAQENKEEDLRKLYDQIKEKERNLKELEKKIGEEKEVEDVNEEIEQNKPKITSKEIRDFIKSRDNVSNTDKIMLEKVVELVNQFPDESLSGIYENRYLIGKKSEKVAENQRRIIRFFKIFLNELHRQDNLDAINEKNNLDELNELISLSLKIIRENPLGIDEKTLMKKLKTSEENLQRVLPRILRLENISDEVKIVNGIYKNIIKEVESADITELSPGKESKQEIKKPTIKPKKLKTNPKIEKLVNEMIGQHNLNKYSINKHLKQRLTIEFVKGKSISEICKSNPEYSKNEILNHIITDKRLPVELKKMENEQYFDSDKEISLLIPLFAVNYYQWEGAKKDEQNVIDLAVEIKKCLTNNPKLRERFGK